MTKQAPLVVVDGSNLATEGRTVPSLRQLDEAVRAFLEEHPDVEVIVVVDATFEHRIAPAERAQFKQAEVRGELVTPPAGVVGRGDAFILKIAQRADAIVLSNDSFQEFHAEHPWLFEEGRLVGGKPVPRVGWIFTARNPVRGQKSKVATTKAARAASAAKRATAKEEPAKETPEPTIPEPKTRAAKRSVRNTPAEAPRAAAKRTAKASAEPRSPSPRGTARGESASGAKRRAKQPAPDPAPARSAKRPSKAAVAPTTVKAAVKVPDAKSRLEPVNTARSFQRLVTDHLIGSVVDGEVVQFTSHGAMVAVRVGRTMRVICYAPLAGLGSPPPTRARDVLKKGEVHKFTVISFDSTRRRAELTLFGTH
jgi:Zc3h12a-like Ribonuclease NYN domain